MRVRAHFVMCVADAAQDLGDFIDIRSVSDADTDATSDLEKRAAALVDDLAFAITPLGIVISTSSRVSKRVLRRPMAETLPRSPESRFT